MSEARRAGKAFLPVIALSALLAIVGALLKNEAIWLHYLCKPLTTILIFVLAWRASNPVSARFQRAILLGIACSLCGDIFLMLPANVLSSGFLFGLCSFLIAHLFFLRALTSDARLFGKPLIVLAFALIGGTNLTVLWPGLAAGLKVPVLGYVLCLVAMSSQAASRHLELRTLGSRFAALGGVFFLISDTVLAYNKFYAAIPAAAFWILATYYTALYLIARSVASDPQSN